MTKSRVAAFLLSSELWPSYRVRLDLLGEDADSPGATADRARMMASPPVAPPIHIGLASWDLGSDADTSGIVPSNVTGNDNAHSSAETASPAPGGELASGVECGAPRECVPCMPHRSSVGTGL